MAELDKANILASFQAATGIEDLGKAFSYLEEVEWDLARALDKFTFKQHEQAEPVALPSIATPAPAPAQAPVATPVANYSGSYQLSVNVKFEEQFSVFKVYSSKTISEFKTEVSVKFNIPSTHIHLLGWERVVNDEMTLGDIVRPRGTLNLTAEKRSDDSRVVSLQLTYPPDLVEEFSFPVKKTILELKQHVAAMSGIQVMDQTWSGLPIGATDYSVIRNCNFKNPIHALAVNRKFVVSESPVSPNPGKNMEWFAQQKMSPEPDGSSSDYDSEPDIDLIDDMDDTPRDNFKDPMIPENCIDQSEALVLFSDNFEKRYGPIHPVFYCGTMKEVINKASKGQLQERRPVAVYLHHDKSISSNIFCEKILCSKVISDFLTSSYLTWAWDMTEPTNTTRFLDNVSMCFGDEIKKQLGVLGPSNYPLLLIFHKKPNSPLEISRTLTMDTLHDDALNILIAGYEEHLSDIEQMQAANEARVQREQIKQEQDAAYNESAEKDKRAFEDKIKSKAAMIRLEEDKLRKMALSEDSIQTALKKLPEEPEKADLVTSIRFRSPDGDVMNRRFFGSDNIGLLYTYAQSRGFPRDRYRLVLNCPRKDLKEHSGDKNLMECGLFPQAYVFIEEHFESN